MTESSSLILVNENPVNTPLSHLEIIARNIYHTSQYDKKLKTNRFYPNYKRESRYFPGRHTCRLSVQRMCHAGLERAIYWANQVKGATQTLVGFEMAPAAVAVEHGFGLEPFAHDLNPYHAHIFIKEFDLPFPQPEDKMAEIMNPAVKHRLDNMARSFRFIKIEDIAFIDSIFDSEDCVTCLKQR